MTGMSGVVDEKTLLKCFRDPESTVTDEERALRLLSRYPRPERVREIRDQEVHHNSDHNLSLLHYACWNGWYDVSRELVDKYQCDPHLKTDWWKCTPLHFACEGGSIDIVRFLIVDHHCNPACRGKDVTRTPLHYACESGKLDIVKFLVEECHCDPRVQGSLGDTPLHCACEGGSIDIVRFLIVDHHCDPACCGWHSRTPLHYACKSGKLDIVKFLVKECHCDPIRGKDDIGCTPLHLAASWEYYDVVLFLLSHIPTLKLVNSVIIERSSIKLLQAVKKSQIPTLKSVKSGSVIEINRHSNKLLQAVKKCRTEYPLESAFKIFALGNHAAGKSTLVKVIENEITSYFGSFGGQLRNISKSTVVPLTAGIIPVSIVSRRLGQIVIYDMAGHYQYYSSHAALLRSLVSSSASMFLVVVSLNQEKEEIICQLQYWNSFIDNCCSSAGRPWPPTVAVFSHADEVTEDKPERKSSEIVKGLAHSEASSSFSGVVTLDCRKLASDGLTQISKIVAGCCVKFRKTVGFDFAIQLLYAFISSRLANRIACTVSELQSLIKQEQGEDSFALKIEGKEYLPTNTTELSQHLTTLSNKGQFLFLRNARKVEDSWVIIDKAVLLSEVNGTIFAPDNFKQHHNIANSTGVVPFSKIREVFPERDPDMVVAFLQHLEFCKEISEAEVSLISSQHFRCSCGPVERFFFFPALVSEERPSGAGKSIGTPSYRCGWTLQCSRPHQFLTPQFLHVLLLRLAFSFALAPDDTHEVQVSPVLERRCSVWKNGICWLSRDGVETTVEETKQSSTYIVTMQSISGQEMECTRYCSQVVKCILDAKEELCPTVAVRESLIHLDDPTTGDIDSQHTFSIAEVAEALAEDKAFVVSQPGSKVVRIDDLLYFEPYAYVRAVCLIAEDNPVSEAFLSEVSRTSKMKVDQLKQVLSIDSAKFQAALGQAPPFQRDQPEYQCKLVFQVWKENTQSPTYGALRSALDKYSVFCGRNPLELAGVRGAQVPPNQLGLATSPNVQEADECVAGATVSLDELTVQPDFPHDDSELSDDDTGSDSPAQSTLPQRTDDGEQLDGDTGSDSHSLPQSTLPQRAESSKQLGDDIGSNPPAQSTPPQRTDQPKLYQLQKFKGRGRRTVKVIEQVAPVWEQLACSLRFQPAVIRTIDRKNHYQCDLACMDMFGRWLEGSTRQPVSWETLMAALRDSGEHDLKKLATVLDAALH